MLTCLYFGLIVAGGTYVFVTFIIGELIDFGEGVSNALEGVTSGIGDALGNAVEGVQGIFGGADAAGADHADISDSLSADSADHSGPSPLSGRTIAMFLTGFGAGGITGKGLGLSDLLSILPALSVGVLGAFLIWIITSKLYALQGSTTIQDTDYVGVIGRVTIGIPKHGRGMVALDVRGFRMNTPAAGEGGAAIAAWTQVEVLTREGGVATVKELK